MKAYALFQEYIWLVNTIHRFGRLTLEEINQRWLDTELSEGVPIARSTFNRHRDAILDMFGIIIECDKKDGFRYFIFNEEVLDEDTIQNWMLSTLSVNSILSESKAVQKRILLESIPSDGDNLHKFIDAMKRGVRVKVDYRRYGADATVSEWKLDPYFVKLFNKRWYALVKFPDPNANLFTLAFDRIISLEVTEDKYEYAKDFDPAGWFKESYGIVRDPDIPVQRVVIRAYGREVPYMRDLPFHQSQKELATTEEYSDFEMMLRPTADFFSPLLSRGPAIKVLEPESLAKDIREMHQAAANLYKE